MAALARFRNAHSPRPYLSQRLHAQRESCCSSSSSSSDRSRRRRRAPSRLAQWPVAAATTAAAAAATAATAAGRGNEVAPAHRANPSPCFTAREDGTVEVRAVGGNARLTLSASRTVAEVDYAVAIPDFGGAPADTAGGGGGVLGGESLQAAANSPRSAHKDHASRVWVTRQFLVGSGSSGVPPEFSHALAVALRAPSQPPAAGAVGDRGCVIRPPAFADGAGGGGGGGGGRGFVASELPRPESRPDDPR